MDTLNQRKKRRNQKTEKSFDKKGSKFRDGADSARRALSFKITPTEITSHSHLTEVKVAEISG